MRRPQVWKTVLFFVGWIVCLHSERLDTLDPIIRKSPAISVNSDDFFGYAIVLHQIEVPATGNFTESLSVSRWVIVIFVTVYSRRFSPLSFSPFHSFIFDAQ